jgi:hypothetical protein
MQIEIGDFWLYRDDHPTFNIFKILHKDSPLGVNIKDKNRQEFNLTIKYGDHYGTWKYLGNNELLIRILYES